MDYFDDEQCDQCGTTSYCIVNGTKVCENGHDQGEGQIVGEDDDFVTQGRTVRRKVEKVKQRRLKVYRGPRAYRLFLQGYQFILWKQCYILIHEKGLPPELWKTVRDLWALRLTTLAHRLETLPKLDLEDQSFSSADESRERVVQKASRTLSKRIDHPRLVETVGLCYMGMLLLRLPIGLADLYRWIKAEDIPYVHAIHGVPLDIREKLPGEYHESLDTTAMPQPEELPEAISYLATVYQQTFGLALPQLNHEILLHRYIVHLALPLEIFPAVQRLTQTTQSQFRYSARQEARRKQGFAFPELQLMSLLVIAVKLLYPFDTPRNHAPSSDDSVNQRMDWASWKQHRQDLAQGFRESSMVPGSKVDVCDTDVFKMSQQQLDSYMDWYQTTWVRESRSGSDDHVSKAILDMFPLRAPDATVRQSPLRREKDLEEAAIRKAQATTSSLKFQRPVAQKRESHGQPDTDHPAQDYTTYKTGKDLPESAKSFFSAAAETACTSVKNLILAVVQAEAKIATWKRAKRRAEATGQGLDLSAEMRRGSGGGPEARIQQDMEAIEVPEDIQSEGSQGFEGSEESGGETISEDM